MTLEQSKIFQKSIISGSFNASLAQGVVVDGHRYANRATIDDLRLLIDYMTIKNTEPVPVKDADGGFAMLSLAQVKSVIDALVVFGVECWMKKGQLEMQIDACSSVDSVLLVVW